MAAVNVRVVMPAVVLAFVVGACAVLQDKDACRSQDDCLSFLVCTDGRCVEPPTRVTFQQGARGYTGTRTVNISSLNLAPEGQFGDNGTTFADGLNDWSVGHHDGASPFDVSPLLRFTSLDVPRGSVVLSARLTVALQTWNEDQHVTGRYLAVSWFGDVQDASGGVFDAPVGWRRRENGIPWSALGARGPGDVVPGKELRFPPEGSLVVGEQPRPYTVELDVAEVQKWVDAEATNHGVLLMGGDATSLAHMVPAQRDPSARDPSLRPLLEITYRAP